ncbi:putative disease resistance protein RGA4 [Impatiens glandulifera]|uniref:putative disease resistance protein RGA4 n=1 Tax=Impatiens glandulifera TaxID=253017 RepID=UPI001FB07500|nr:putative disease resistance protein RGA4 [Impatiens glandulifera]
MADPATLISGLLSNLAPLIKDEFSLFWNFKKDLENLSKTLSAIDAALEDAEIKNVWKKDRQTEGWLRELKDVAYEVRDIMDECTFEDLRLQVKRRNASSSTRKKVTNFITLPLSNTWSRHEIGSKIKDVQEKLEQIYSRRNNLQLREPIHDSKIKEDKFASSWRETMSLSSSRKVYGRDKEKKEIIDILLNNNTSGAAKELSVLPIVGMGGLGKTTLAQMVYNDHEVSKHFDLKFWVCVSDEFDIKVVIKSILEKKGANNETSLEDLQKKVRGELGGKRYLIVLDDIWNENEEAWAKLRSILDCGSNGAFILTTTRKPNVAEIMKTIKSFELQSLSEDDCWLLIKERAFEDGKPKCKYGSNLINISKEIARKCKGVPLVAMTLGSQLRSCDGENEWRRIRDSELWEISENEKDLLPILRLSYYDLPYYLRRCFVFCAIFPKDTVIEKEKLIQLWMAHGLISPVTKQEVEDVGNRIWKELCWRSFFQDEKENKNMFGIVYTTCMMHDLMHDLSQSVMKDECYTIDAKRSSDVLEREVRHVTILVDELEQTSVSSLKKIGGLQSIMFDGEPDYDGNVTKEILSVLKKFLPLRVLEVRHHVKYQDLSHVRRLKHLRYLDISHGEITTLPNSICELFNLQTLILNYCSKLESLPRNIWNLISLRHLYLKNYFDLKYMPRGMGQLKHLKTLSLLVIGKKERDCQLDEIRELNIGGSLKINNLGRVSDASIARGISMAKKSCITILELNWGRYTYDDDANRHEKIGEALEILTERLRILTITYYKGVNPPKWVGKSSPSIGSSSNSNDSEMMIVLFPLLEELTIYMMKNLRELVSPTTIPAFPNLCKLKISYCPKLGALPVPYLKALKDVSVQGKCSDELLYSISNLSTLTHLQLCSMEERSVLFGTGYMALMFDDDGIQLGGGVRSTFQSLQSLIVLFPLLEELTISWMKNLRELVSPTAIPSPGVFPNLCKMKIKNCPKLRALPPHLKAFKDVSVEGECSDELLYSISNLSALTHLELCSMEERSVLFGAGYMALMFDDDEIPSSSSSSSKILGDNNNNNGGGVRSTFQSLQSLFIQKCLNLRGLFDEGMIIKISGCEKQQKHHHLQAGQTERTRGLMNSLTNLYIYGSPELMISVEEFGNLTSLQSLRIRGCPKLVSSEDVIALLRSLRARLGPKNFYVDIELEKEEGEHSRY